MMRWPCGSFRLPPMNPPGIEGENDGKERKADSEKTSDKVSQPSEKDAEYQNGGEENEEEVDSNPDPG